MATHHRKSKYQLGFAALALCVALIGVFTWRHSDDARSRPPQSEFSGPANDYERVFQESFDRVAKTFPALSADIVHSRNVRELVTLAYCSSRLYQVTGEKKYLDWTRQSFRAVLRAWDEDPELMRQHHNPFFVAELFFQVEGFLDANHELSGLDRATIATYVDQLAPTLGREDNQNLAFAVGLAFLQKQHPGHALEATREAEIEKSWQRWYAYKHNIENATTYTAIGWNAIFSLARNLDRTAALDDESIREIFDRHRELIAPSGAVTNWGDSYFGKSWTYWVLHFENAHRFYDDESMREAAQRVFWWGVQNQPVVAGDNEEQNFDELNRLKPLADLVGLRLEGDCPVAKSGRLIVDTNDFQTVTARAIQWERRLTAGRTHLDKLVLKSGGKQFVHHMMLDLFANGFHAHHNRRGSVLFFESRGTPFFHSLDRHNKSVEDAGSFVVMSEEYESTFPSNHEQMVSRWVTERIPLRLLADELDGKQAATEIELIKIVLRFSAKQDTEGILFDNLRITGPAGTHVLDDMSGINEWTGEFTRIERDAGDMCLDIGGAAGVRFISSDNWLPRRISMSEFTHLEYDWKDLAPTQRNRVLLRLYTDNRLGQFDFDARNHHVYPEVASCLTRQDAGDAFARIDLGDYGIRGSRLIRQLALLRSGTLVIVDRYDSPADAQPQLAGPVWNYHQQDVESHGHWFVNARPERSWYRAGKERTAVDPARLLVWFPPGQGDIGTLDRRLHFGMTTTAFSKSFVQAGDSITTVCVMRPIAASDDPKAVADSMEWKPTGRTYTLKIGVGTESRKIDFQF